ncbi:MAG: 16S rRNA (cytosine(1402)-N(4))-methyltransferase RsmH [Patescibacteria group bacterium]|nr:16S rRNA (cytosine(1402)-N(4))-methyltransferase RsmH [Patescibacteria group bacterium]
MILQPTDSYHTPVLLSEVLDGLRIRFGAKYIDATLGGGGYTFAIAENGGKVLGVDRDNDALKWVSERLEKDKLENGVKGRIVLSKGNFGNLGSTAKEADFNKVDGIVFDLGMSTHQLESSGRGFSFRKTGEPLDMRMDINTDKTAAYILNSYPKEKLYEIFSKYAEELNSGAIASAIVLARAIKPIVNVGQLVDIVSISLHRRLENKYSEQKINNSLARIFQSLRIEVNGEMKNLVNGLSQAIDLLSPKGRLCIVSYHSLEDRLVKIFFRKNSREKRLNIVTKRPITVKTSEFKINKRSRSGKLRIAEKV